MLPLDEPLPPPRTNWKLFWAALLLPTAVMVLMPLLMSEGLLPKNGSFVIISYTLALIMGPTCGWILAGATIPTMPGRLLIAVPFSIAFMLLGFILSFFGCAAVL